MMFHLEKAWSAHHTKTKTLFAITEYQLGPHVIVIVPLTLPPSPVSKSGNPGLLVDRILLPKAKRSDLSDRVYGVPSKSDQLHGTIRKF